MIHPKGAKVYVRAVEKENKETTTTGGIILEPKDKTSGDDALLNGVVLEAGAGEIDSYGFFRNVDVEIGTSVFFNRYNAFKVYTKGLDTFWIVDVRDIWCVGEIE